MTVFQPDSDSAVRHLPSRRPFHILYLTAFCSMLGVGIIVPFLPNYAKSVGAQSYFFVGLIFGSMNISRLIFLPIMRREAQWGRRKKRTILMEGLAFYCFISLAYLLSANPFTLMVVRFFNGLAASMVLPVSMAIVGELTPKMGEGREMGDFQLAMMSGFGIGPLLGGVLDDAFGYWSAFLAMGLLNLAALLLVKFSLPEVENPSAGLPPSKRKHEYRKALANPIVLGVLIFRFINAVGRGSSFSFIPLLATDPHYLSLNHTQIGLIICSIALVAGGLGPFFGRLADRLSRVQLVIIGSTGFTLCMLVMPHCPGFYSLFAVALLSGAFGAVALPASAAITVVEGRSYGMITMMVMFDMAMSLGQFMGPPLGGLVGDTYNLGVTFYFSGFLSLIGTVIFYLLLKNTDANKKPTAI